MSRFQGNDNLRDKKIPIPRMVKSGQKGYFHK
jgi:hypothetical protein